MLKISSSKTASRAERALAWGVHGYTALGLGLAAAIAVLIVEGDAESLLQSLALMWATTVIDATDGYLARYFRVKEVLPEFDGRRLDDLTDFLTYTCLPLLLVWRAGLLGGYSPSWLLFPLLASAYGFCQTQAKTDDGFFLGFPSYWNLIAMYLYLLRPSPDTSLFLIVFFAALTFVPARYLYSTQPGRLNRWTNAFAALWAAWVALLLYRSLTPPLAPPADDVISMAYYSLVFPAYYLITSWVLTWQLRSK